MVGFALFGAGRIGRMHADNLAASARADLVAVYDVHEPSAREVSDRHGALQATSVEEALGANGVDAVLIASSTDTHVDLIMASAAAGKAVLCEKPIDLDIDRVERCREAIAGLDVPVQIGFNRRFDPTHIAVRDAVRAGEVGKVEQVIIISRDPAPPPRAYLEASGGLYRDMMIHDFDLARFVLEEEPVEVFAMGSSLFDSNAASVGDVDTAMVQMRTGSGVLCQIACSRRAVYGYDQRLEVFGAKGMVRSNNLRPNEMDRFGAQGTALREPLLDFFIERYGQAYLNEIDDFLDTVESGGEPSVTFEDGRRALLLANAAVASLASGAAVKVEG